MSGRGAGPEVATSGTSFSNSSATIMPAAQAWYPQDGIIGLFFGMPPALTRPPLPDIKHAVHGEGSGA